MSLLVKLEYQFCSNIPTFIVALNVPFSAWLQSGLPFFCHILGALCVLLLLKGRSGLYISLLSLQRHTTLPEVPISRLLMHLQDIWTLTCSSLLPYLPTAYIPQFCSNSLPHGHPKYCTSQKQITPRLTLSSVDISPGHRRLVPKNCCFNH